MTWTSVLVLSVIAGASALPVYGATDKFLFDVSESVPCGTTQCNGTINLTGTITTDALGGLTLANLVEWNLDFSADGQTVGTLTQSNSSFIALGNPQIVATSDLFIITINTTADEFDLSSTSTPLGIWTFSGGGPSKLSAETLSWTSRDVQLSGRKSLTLPSNFEAVSGLNATPVPEPANILVIPIASLILTALRRFNFNRVAQSLTDRYSVRS